MKYLFAFYSWIITIVGLLLFFFGFLILSFFISFDRLDCTMKRCIRFFFRLSFIKVTIENIEKIDSAKAYVFMANHVSFLDSFVLYAYIPNMIKGIEIASHFRWPVYGYFIRKFGNIPIDQSSVGNSLKSIREAQEYIKSGKSILIFPEGERTHNGQMNEFKRLPFLLAQEAHVDIVPVALSGLYSILPFGSALIKPGSVTVTFGNIIPVEQIDEFGSRAVCKMTHDCVSQLRREP